MTENTEISRYSQLLAFLKEQKIQCSSCDPCSDILIPAAGKELHRIFPEDIPVRQGPRMGGAQQLCLAAWRSRIPFQRSQHGRIHSDIPSSQHSGDAGSSSADEKEEEADSGS